MEVGKMTVPTGRYAPDTNTNCKNCGGTRDLYSCHYCGTVYHVRPAPVVIIKKSWWQRFCDLFRRKKLVTISKNVLIMIGAVCIGALLTVAINNAMRKR